MYQKNQFETTIDKMNRAVKMLQMTGKFTRKQAIKKLVADLEKAGAEFDAEYAKANLH